ncbi:MAG TPA: hypothetical protein VLK84_31115 [Longimicrobium sp.]|nr:hypothetical protein [Longimicrobium sp.]
MSKNALLFRKLGIITVVILLTVVLFAVFSRLVPGARVPAAEAFAPTQVLGLSMAAPGPFQPIHVPIPQQVRTSVERIESSGRNAGRTELRVSRMEYKAGVPLSLEGSAQGAVDAVRQNPAVSEMTHTHAPAQVSGLPAVRTTSRFQVSGRPAHGEILTVLHGRTLWQVQVMGPASQAKDIAKRVMESVQVQP